ncbi:unnamed protein product [Phaedon cochleariae]|uniref:Uncharacterized protein n=1 Tax=Phaedon cochleariae TaxID=80249 RepID=A0A9N9SGX5_PHACE|nr:unnamed protein product [Phaedon cochleariae]
MFQESKDLIIKNFVTLMKKCNVDVLVPLMLDKGVFTEKEINEIFSTNDARQNKRVFFFNIQKKDQVVFKIFLESLIETNQKQIADLFLRPSRTGASVFKDAVYNEDSGDLPNLELQNHNLHVDPSTTPLNVQVTCSKNFFDTYEHNHNLEFYKSRSINRGRAVIINNYRFSQNHPYRNGAEVDSQNLEELFYQMGGWDFVKHENKTAREMQTILYEFRDCPNNKDYDAFFIIIMSHGTENSNDTVIYGIDEGQLDSTDVQNTFSNENCQSMRGKPKVFILPMCRGARIDIATNVENKQNTTEHDSIPNKSNTSTSITVRKRSTEDMLVGYSTLQGFKAHRDTNRGSWYIEFLCDVFMKHAHNTSVDELLMMIDQRLRYRASEDCGMQTAEHRNKGFKKLYLHPGIYFEGNALKNF